MKCQKMQYIQPTSQNGFLKHEMSKNAVQPLAKHENAKHKYGKW